MSTEKLLPCRFPISFWCRLNAMALQNVRYSCACDAMPEIRKCALNSAVTPTVILFCHAKSPTSTATGEFALRLPSRHYENGKANQTHFLVVFTNGGKATVQAVVGIQRQLARKAANLSCTSSFSRVRSVAQRSPSVLKRCSCVLKRAVIAFRIR